MLKNIEKTFKSLVLINFFISVLITIKVFTNFGYNFSSEISIGLLITFIYAGIWFYSLYRICARQAGKAAGVARKSQGIYFSGSS